MEARSFHSSLIGYYRSLSMSTQVLLWVLLGAIFGVFLSEQARALKPIGDLYMRLLLMAAIPLLFISIISGISRLSGAKSMGKLGLSTITFYSLTTILAIVVAMMVSSILTSEGYSLWDLIDAVDEKSRPSFRSLLIEIVPANIFSAFSEGNVLQIVVVALFLGFALIFVPIEHSERLQEGLALLNALLRKIMDMILIFSPIGIGALVASSVAEIGADVFKPVLYFLVTVWAAQIFMVIFYLFILRFRTQFSVFDWLGKTMPVYATTIATCSSLASLLMSMKVAEKRLALPEHIYSVTLPLGTQLNKDGTAITLITMVMTATHSFGVQFSVIDMMMLGVYTLVLSFGSGGIPHGGLVLAFVMLGSLGFPLEVAGVLVSVYRLIDMGNTTTNCMGDMVWASLASEYFDLPDKGNAG